MSLDDQQVARPSKGVRIKEKVERTLSPAQQERYSVIVQKDRDGLTKLSIRVKIPYAGERGTAGE
jgi:hypothetical protein